MREEVIVLDFGSQYNQLIARSVRELGVYAEILPNSTPWEQIEERDPAALILSGGPASVDAEDAATIDERILDCGIPALGICYGMQLIIHMLGGSVQGADRREYGPARLRVEEPDRLLQGLEDRTKVWMSHGDQVKELPEGFRIYGSTETCPYAAVGEPERKFYGVQFHPEVVHTERGTRVFRNFLFDIADCRGGWTMRSFIDQTVEQIRDQVGGDRVICGLSGGVDSGVTAALVNRAVGDQAMCIFMDNGLLRKNEAEEVRRFFTEDYPVNLHFVDASEEFLSALEGVVDPEAKRKRIGEVFIDVFQREADKLGGARFLAQGTLYPDVIESRSAHGGPSATIKSHHNVGGLPDELDFELVEPLRELFKDEVREVGRELGLPEELVERQPFPGPGLAVRVIGEITPDRLQTLREADARVREELEKYDGCSDIWQYFAVLLPIKSVGVMGDGRTYANVVAVRAVHSVDGMTSDWAKIPDEVLERISSRVINEVDGVNRVVYDISPKPPSTIEWE